MRNIKFKLVLELSPMAHKPLSEGPMTYKTLFGSLFISLSCSRILKRRRHHHARFQWRRFWVICLPLILTISVNIVPPTLLIPLLVLPLFSSLDENFSFFFMNSSENSSSFSILRICIRFTWS